MKNINMIKKLSVLLLLCSFSAVSGQWPVITSIRTEFWGGRAYHFIITQKLIEIGPSVDVVVPDKYIELTHRHNPMTSDTVGDVLAMAMTSSSRTVSDEAVDLYNTTGASVSDVGHTGEDPTGTECVAYVVSPYNDGLTHTTYWSNIWAPGGCMVVPPADEWCKITTPEITFDHGAMTLANAEGDSVTKTLGLQCTTDSAVTFNLITKDNYIYLDEGKSEITVDNKPLNTEINVKQGDSQLVIKDLLTGVTSEGEHTGSSVLVMMPY